MIHCFIGRDCLVETLEYFNEIDGKGLFCSLMWAFESDFEFLIKILYY